MRYLRNLLAAEPIVVVLAAFMAHPRAPRMLRRHAIPGENKITIDWSGRIGALTAKHARAK